MKAPASAGAFVYTGRLLARLDQVHRMRVLCVIALVLPAGCGTLQTPPESVDSVPAVSASASPATGDGSATIEGRVSYPAGFRPQLDVYAIDVDDSTAWYTVTVAGTEEAGHDPRGAYSLDVAPGTYYVLAYTAEGADSWAGLYSVMVQCGLTATCTDHTLLPVTVMPGETATGIDPGDWYYPQDHDYPDRPE